MRVLVAAAVLLTSLSPALLAQTAPHGSLLVLSKHDHTLSIVDPSSLKVLAALPVGEDPHEVVASTDGTTAYVSNYGFGALHSLAVLDLAGRRALPSIDLGPLRGPHGLTFVGGKVWFTAEGAKAIGRYDPATQKVDWVLGTGQDRTHMIYVAQDERRIVTTNVSSGTVSLIAQQALPMPGPPPGIPPGGRGPEPHQQGNGERGPAGQRKDWHQTVVRVGNGAEGFDVSPDQRQIWVANAQDGTLSVIDTATSKVVQTVDAKVRSANRLKITPDGKFVLVSLLAGPDLLVFDAATGRESKRIPVGHGAAGIEVEPDGSRAFVACTPDNYVSVVDLHSFTVVGHIEAGGEPDGLAWAATH